MFSSWLLSQGLAFFADSAGGARLPLLADCSQGSDVVASIETTTPVSIRYSMAGDSETCYAVTVTLDGKALNGYLLGARHPAIAQFDSDPRGRIPEIPPPPPAASPIADKTGGTSGTEETVSFAGFRAVDFDGRRVDLNASRAENVLLYFWSPYDRGSAQKAEAMDGIYETYHPRGVDVVGIASGVSAARLRAYCEQNEVSWPQVIDSGEIAARYHIDAAKPFLLLDRHRNVIAVAGSAQALALTLDRIAGRRRIVDR